MAKQTEMVGEIEIIATTKSLQRTIEVFVDTSKIVYGREFSATKPPIRLQFLAGVNDAGHYICIIPGNTFITPQILSPVRNFNHQQRGLTTRSEILTSSPYKRRLSWTKSLQPRAKKTKLSNKPRVTRQSKVAVLTGPKISAKKAGNSWFCILCEEDRVEDMVRCVNSGTWIHATCAGGIPPNHQCDLC